MTTQQDALAKPKVIDPDGRLGAVADDPETPSTTQLPGLTDASHQD